MNPDPPLSSPKPKETGWEGFGSNKLYQEGWAQYILTAGLPSNRCATQPYQKKLFSSQRLKTTFQNEFVKKPCKLRVSVDNPES